LVAWVLPNSIRPTSLMYAWKIPYNPITHFFTSGQHYPLQPSKIPCEFLVHSHLLASVLASNYPNVHPKYELQAWWNCSQCSELSFSKEIPKYYHWFLPFCLCICPVCLSFSCMAQAFPHKPCVQIATFQVSSLIKESMQIHALPWLVSLQKERK
jgi:hypothetical protein